MNSKTLTIFFSCIPAVLLTAQDMPLSQVLIDGEDWEVASTGHAFTDACTTDADGNFYFSDVREGEGVYRIPAAGGATELWLKDLPGLSGMQFGPDGRLYACQGREQRVIAITPKTGEVDVLATDVRPNDLVVTHKGAVYFTHTKPQEIGYISPEGEYRVVHQGGFVRPNGITLSTDQGMLIVSDHGGKHVWALRIEENGDLSFPQPYMTTRTPIGSEEGKGDGAASDKFGRYYITTATGLHMYDPTGRLGGVISKPGEGNLVSVEFSGPNLAWLYVACADTIYRRKTKSTGILAFLEPKPIEKYPR